MFWASPEQARSEYDRMLELVDVVVGNRAEMAVATGIEDPAAAAADLLERGVRVALVKLGADGVLVATAGRIGPGATDPGRGRVRAWAPATPSGARLIHGLLAGWDPVRCAQYGNAAGAIVVGQLACADAMPTLPRVAGVPGPAPSSAGIGPPDDQRPRLARAAADQGDRARLDRGRLRPPSPADQAADRTRHHVPGCGRPSGPRRAAVPAAIRWPWPIGAGCSNRLVTALSHPDVNGVLGSPDVIEELLLLGALENKVVLGSMNRGGLDGARWTMDDRFTGYDAASIAACGLEGGKMLLRIDDEDAGSLATLHACSQAVTELARHRLVAMVEPLPYRRGADGRLTPADRCRRAGPGGDGRVGVGHHQRLHLAQDAGLRRAGAGLRRDDLALRGARRGARDRTWRPRWRPGAGRCDSRWSVDWWSGGPCSIPTAVMWPATVAAAARVLREARA